MIDWDLNPFYYPYLLCKNRRYGDNGDKGINPMLILNFYA
jgi:hypothetical protein